jgi:hypothetical protein
MGQYLHTTLPRRGGPKVNPGWMLKEGEKAEKGRDGGLREFRGKTERKRKKYKHKRTYFVEMLIWGLGEACLLGKCRLFQLIILGKLLPQKRTSSNYYNTVEALAPTPGCKNDDRARFHLSRMQRNFQTENPLNYFYVKCTWE